MTSFRIAELEWWRIAIVVFIVAFIGGVLYFFSSAEEVLLAAVITIISIKNRKNPDIYNTIAYRKWIR